MTLIKSISGIRGTIGGFPGQGLTPPDIVKFTAGFARWAQQQSGCELFKPSIVVGRDARISGEIVENLVVSTLTALGLDVIMAGLATTPTVEMAVTESKSLAGIIITASHNPAEWNALKLLNRFGEFISADDGAQVLDFSEASEFSFAPVNSLGKVSKKDFLDYHIQKILDLEWVDKEAISNAGFRIIVDGINSVGAIAVPKLLGALGVIDFLVINSRADGHFAHNPEPLPEHLSELSAKVVQKGATLGIVIDPDVDRLAFVNEDGSMFGEEYTLVAVADYIFDGEKGHAVSNLSSSRALSVIAGLHGCTYSAAAVGEVNVVTEMKKRGALIGGEGNGGIILPKLHYGRDALVGIGLFLSHLAKSGLTMTGLKSRYPNLYMDKSKVVLEAGINPDDILTALEKKYIGTPHSTVDGLKVDFEDSWFHVRRSNTEPIMRVYTEAQDSTRARELGEKITQEILSLVKIC